MITRKRKQSSIDAKHKTSPSITKLTKISENKSQNQQTTNFLQDLKKIVEALSKNHDKSCKTLLKNVLRSSNHKTKTFKKFKTAHSSILKEIYGNTGSKTLTVHEIYNDFVLSACLYNYCRKQNENQNENDQIIIPGVCMFLQMVGGSGILVNSETRDNQTILTAKHVLGESDDSKIGLLKLGFLGNEIVLMKCVKETGDSVDLAFLDIIYRFDWDNNLEIPLETSNSETIKLKSATVDINSSVFCYGYPSIILDESDFGDPQERDGPEKVVSVEGEKYVAWEPPMWNSVDSDYVDIRLRPKKRKLLGTGTIENNYTAFYHGAIKYGGFSGAPIFQKSYSGKGALSFVGIHHGWDDKICLGMATAACSIPGIE